MLKILQVADMVNGLVLRFVVGADNQFGLQSHGNKIDAQNSEEDGN
jgi:hypothetical protein